MASSDLPPRVRGALMLSTMARCLSRLTPACAGSTVPRNPVKTHASTYPRVCGEHRPDHDSGSQLSDLPPRVRGARLRHGDHPSGARLTPACAGSTQLGRASARAPSTYPRVCGEHAARARRNLAICDLPPRVRGARHGDIDSRLIFRLTPACAGSTHPSCPEDPPISDLPPRVRGARTGGGWSLREVRLTPACAGSTRRASAGACAGTTYPRVCGEHRSALSPARAMSDLPPRVRGAHRVACVGHVGLRLTPACAGSTTSASSTPSATSTYPRVCGEHHQPPGATVPTADLPPRVRGAPPTARRHSAHGRLTPACAGSTTNRPAPQCPRPTYPRVCGEHLTSSVPSSCIADLPPRVRGALGDDRDGHGGLRLTPACAGSTCSSM